MLFKVNKEDWAKAGVYRLICRETSDMYIGSTQHLRKRFLQHSAGIKTKDGQLYERICTIGSARFVFEAIELWDGAREALYEREHHYINLVLPTLNTAMLYAEIKAQEPKEELSECQVASIVIAENTKSYTYEEYREMIAKAAQVNGDAFKII